MFYRRRFKLHFAGILSRTHVDSAPFLQMLKQPEVLSHIDQAERAGLKPFYAAAAELASLAITGFEHGPMDAETADHLILACLNACAEAERDGRDIGDWGRAKLLGEESHPIHTEIERIYQELQRLKNENTKEQDENVGVPPGSTNTLDEFDLLRQQGEKRAIVKCPKCLTKLRLPAGRSGTVQCPTCREKFRAST
jgi:hypothetical protein